MLRREGLDTGDTRDHLEFEGAATRVENRLQDTHGAVVQRRITPDQKTSALPVRQLFIDQPLEGGLLRTVQIFNAGSVVHVAAFSLGAVGFDETVRTINDVALADFPPQIQQRLLDRKSTRLNSSH